MSSQVAEGKLFEEGLTDYSRTSRGLLGKTHGLSVAVGSVAALSVCTDESEAALVVVVGPFDAPSTGLFSPSETSLIDIDEDATFEFEFIADDNPAYPFVRMGARGGLQVAGYINGAYAYASRLEAGAGVSAGLNFLVANSNADKLLAFSYPEASSQGGEWFGGETGFIGFSIPDGSGERYGWLEVVVNPDGTSGEVLRYAYETTVGEAVIVGVPEASSLACLAMGAAGLLGWRKRSKTA